MIIYEVEKKEKVLMTHNTKLFDKDGDEEDDDVFIISGC